MKQVRHFLEEMKKYFEMSMIGKMKFFLGLQIVQKKDGIFISKSKYLKDLLKIFGLESCKPVGTPMVIRYKLSRKDDSPFFEKNNYTPMIGGLQY